MKDSEAIILQAFLYALSQQKNPLETEINNQLSEIAESLETRIIELDNLANQNITLKNHYKNARKLLTSTAAERGMGLKFPPADSDDQDSNETIDNTTRDTGKIVEEMEEILNNIEKKLTINKAKTILKSPDPVKATQQTL